MKVSSVIQFLDKPLPRNDEKFCLIRYTEWSSFSGPYNEIHRKFHQRMHYSCQNLICFVSIHFVICTCWKRNHNLNIVWQSTWEDLSLFGYTGFIDLGRIYKNLSSSLKSHNTCLAKKNSSGSKWDKQIKMSYQYSHFPAPSGYYLDFKIHASRTWK